MTEKAASAGVMAAGDGELLAAAARRDRLAFAEIVRRYGQPVYRLAWRLTNGHADAADLAQEAFLKLWQNPQQVREAAALKGWLMRVAANAVIDRSRKKQHADIDAVPEIADPAEAQDVVVEREEARRAVAKSIADLPERQQLALSLVYFEGMSNIDAAAAMEISIEAIESLLARARRGLKESLKGDWRNLLDGLNTNAG